MSREITKVIGQAGLVATLGLSLALIGCGGSTDDSGSSSGGSGSTASGASMNSTGGSTDSAAGATESAGGSTNSGGSNNAGGSTNSGGSTSGASGSSAQGGGAGSAPQTTVLCDDKNVVGTWQAVGTGAASVLATFASDGTLEIDVIAAGAAANTFDVEEIDETYTESGGVQSTTPTAISCQSAASASVGSCAIVDGILVGTDSSGTTTAWTPASPPSLSNATVGCFENNTFVPYPLTPLP
jgi:hypothetical protein